ncbi:molybdenum cofactor sulfurase isoform X2 [Malania oleifera]|uniref:molybdenum cofactor sulfurase isoform X2 n=1 Tax=Malania oleifera TaxID=397392 RepID=UPI0025ADAAE2|nr:molybdenum cofactor sulfurase isoform X2 [Malania oleifera]
MNADKQEFLKEFGRYYGYPNGPKSIDDIRASEFKRLDGLVYLDHAGATLYSELQMEAIFKDLTTSVYGNPHSQSDSSSATSDIVRQARQQVLEYCNASPRDYRCIFTSGATAALKLVGEAFPWSSQSCFMYTMENHNSVVGIREYALHQGAAAFAMDIEDADCCCAVSGSKTPSFRVTKHPIQRRTEARFLEEEPIGKAYNLFAFPSECNFSGVRFSLDLVKIIKEDARRLLGSSPYCEGCWMVLIDAAKGCSTEPPDLSEFPADFVVVSFYKLFGYPTGLGALIIRNEAANLFKKTYFSGGTVAASIADIDFVKRREGVEELFEDGTVSFLSIASICHGFKVLNNLTMSAIYRHTMSLATYMWKMLSYLRHENGADVCKIYGRCNPEVFSHDMGPVVTFNLKRPDGSWFGYREVEKLASLYGIQLRTGCFCNPGACAKYLGLSHSDLFSNVEAGHTCWDNYDIVHGKPTGAVRISFGYMSTFEDTKKFIDFIVKYFVSLPNQWGYPVPFKAKTAPFSSADLEGTHSTTGFHLKSITIYPIKSCAGFNTENWPLCSTGLQHDREWLLKSLAGEILTQKKVPEMCLINTFIDLNREILFVESPRCRAKLQINLDSVDLYHGEREEMDIHGQRFEVQAYHDEVNTWFSRAVAWPCILLRCFSSWDDFCLNNKNVSLCRNVGMRLNFANEAQFLLVSEESISDLSKRLYSKVEKGSHGASTQVNPMRFRPNLVISGGEPYAEDKWKGLKIGRNYFSSLGGCNRCQMINFDCQAGQVQKSSEPLATLASYRRTKGKILFGILLRYEKGNEAGHGADSWLRVGQDLTPNTD